MTREQAGKLAAVAFSLVLMGAIEAGCWLWLELGSDPGTLPLIHELLQRDSELLWIARPMQRSEFFGARVVTDEYGLRNAPGAVDSRDPKTYRIVVAGASPSFGWGVQQEATYAKVLERNLQAHGRVEVLNASVVGYSSWQGLKLLRKRLDVLRPDHLVVAYGINDVTRERFFYSGPAEDKDVRVPSSDALNLVFRLATTQVLASLLERGRPSPASFPVRVSVEDYKANHRAIAELARSRGSTVGFLIVPFRFPESSPEPSARVEEMLASQKRSTAWFDAVRALAREERIPLTDTTDPLFSQYERYFLVDKRDYIHPNAAGHAVIAEALARDVPVLP